MWINWIILEGLKGVLWWGCCCGGTCNRHTCTWEATQWLWYYLIRSYLCFAATIVEFWFKIHDLLLQVHQFVLHWIWLVCILLWCIFTLSMLLIDIRDYLIEVLAVSWYSWILSIKWQVDVIDIEWKLVFSIRRLLAQGRWLKRSRLPGSRLTAILSESNFGVNLLVAEVSPSTLRIGLNLRVLQASGTLTFKQRVLQLRVFQFIFVIAAVFKDSNWTG